MIEDHSNRAKILADLFQSYPVPKLIANLNTPVKTIAVNGRTFPITLNDMNADRTCYICCPTTENIDYTIDEKRQFWGNPILRQLVIGLVRNSAPLIRASGLDHQVQVNN